jgi:hypothetical protein
LISCADNVHTFAALSADVSVNKDTKIRFLNTNQCLEKILPFFLPNDSFNCVLVPTLYDGFSHVICQKYRIWNWFNLVIIKKVA